MSAPVIAAADWGTTRLRLWLLDEAGTVLAERRGEDGLAAVAGRGFAAILEAHLAALGAPSDLPVIVCGMAGSRQGWIEAPYVDVPARFEAIARGASRVPGPARDVRIVPGLASRDAERPDVMRGEETQLLGVARSAAGRPFLACLPGTHSKWVACGAGGVEGFRTWMTGELFSLISTRSILAHSTASGTVAVDPASPAFAAGVRAALAAPDQVIGQLFSIRAADLLHGLAPPDAAARLSGLLIGAEIAAATAGGEPGPPLRLVAQGLLGELYGVALDVAGLPFRPFDADEAVRAGLLHAAVLDGMVGVAVRGAA